MLESLSVFSSFVRSTISFFLLSKNLTGIVSKDKNLGLLAANCKASS